MSKSKIGVKDTLLNEYDTSYLVGTARMGFDRNISAVDPNCRSWDIRNLWACEDSVFPITDGMNSHLQIARRPGQDHRALYRQDGPCAFHLYPGASRVGIVECCLVLQLMDKRKLADEFGG